MAAPFEQFRNASNDPIITAGRHAGKSVRMVSTGDIARTIKALGFNHDDSQPLIEELSRRKSVGAEAQKLWIENQRMPPKCGEFSGSRVGDIPGRILREWYAAERTPDGDPASWSIVVNELARRRDPVTLQPPPMAGKLDTTAQTPEEICACLDAMYEKKYGTQRRSMDKACLLK